MEVIGHCLLELRRTHSVRSLDRVFYRRFFIFNQTEIRAGLWQFVLVKQVPYHDPRLAAEYGSRLGRAGIEEVRDAHPSGRTQDISEGTARVRNCAALTCLGGTIRRWPLRVSANLHLRRV